ncbi:MAG: threonine/serine dehydratase [Pseudomonadota bacterium]
MNTQTIESELNAATVVEAASSAYPRLRSELNPTPLLEYAGLNRLVGGRLLLKPENLQRTGSFKIRGALNALDSCLPVAQETGVVAWSSGNHAQGVALAARLRGVQAHIVMPEDAPPAKRTSTERLGAIVIPYDRYTENREAIAMAKAAELGAPVIPSYDHPAVIAGQASIGLELIADPRVADAAPEQVLVCCGGGGLSAGIASVLSFNWPQTRVYAVEPSAADDTVRSLAEGRRVANPSDTRSVCDALLTPTPGALTFPINQALLAGGVSVTDEEALYTVGYARRECRLVLEPGGAVALAAALHNKIDVRDRTTVIILSGGNVDDEMLARGCDIYDRAPALE